MYNDNQQRQAGTVAWFKADKGFGFIIPDGSTEATVFVHYSQIDMDGYKRLRQDDLVTYVPVDNGKGPAAHAVRVRHSYQP